MWGSPCLVFFYIGRLICIYIIHNSMQYLCMWEKKCPIWDWQFPFLDEFDRFWGVGGGGGKAKSLKKIYIPRVIFNIPSPPCWRIKVWESEQIPDVIWRAKSLRAGGKTTSQYERGITKIRFPKSAWNGWIRKPDTWYPTMRTNAHQWCIAHWKQWTWYHLDSEC